MERLFCIIICLGCLLFSVKAKAQLRLPEQQKEDVHFSKGYFLIQNDFSENAPSKMKLRTEVSPKSWNYQDLAFFCKLELKLEKMVQMPVKFRLGEVQYVDWLEGK